MKINKKDILYILKLALILLAISFVCTILLTVVNALTKTKIAERSQKSAQDARIEVLKEADDFKKTDGFKPTDKYGAPVNEIYIGTKDGKTAGYCVSVSPNGYGGAIQMIVGISADMNVTGVKITSMSETPGLGAKASDKSFTNQYIDKAANGDLGVNKTGNASKDEINAISGATISSKAVTSGVNAAAKAVSELMQKEGNQ